MAKDYVLFIHGVRVRNKDYADALEKTIRQDLGSQAQENTQFIPLYWGDIVQKIITPLREQLTHTKTWSSLWFQNTRSEELLTFVGDAALYISRHVGFEMIQHLTEQAVEGLKDYEPGDRLHLVTHSWGTVILFDVLFAERWNSSDLHDDEKALIAKLRDSILGTGEHPDQGLKLGSISTMGSPIVLFNLINQRGDGSSHGIGDCFLQLLQHPANSETKLQWFNFIHPGDPIAWPLEELQNSLVGESVVVTDKLVRGCLTDSLSGTNFFKTWFSFKALQEMLGWLLQKTPVSMLINGGNAHGSYWTSSTVAQTITAQLQPSDIEVSMAETSVALEPAASAAQEEAEYSTQAC